MALKSWLPIPPKSHFSLRNIPFGIISVAKSQNRAARPPRPAIAVGEYALDLATFASCGGLSKLDVIKPGISVFSEPTLNSFAALGRAVHREVRTYLQNILAEDTSYPQLLKDNSAIQNIVLLPLNEVIMHVPLRIGDYTDFYAGRHHAYNGGVLFRGPSNALQPNYTHLPVAYHSRASSVVVSGTSIRRPCGQIIENPTADPKVPIFAPCKRLDIELELGAFVCKANKMGEPIPIAEAGESLFGFVLLNDWSARDIQAWEYVPLGPFNAKNFGTTISPWIVLPDALEPFRCRGIENETELLPYLREEQKENVYDIHLEVDLTTSSGTTTTITRTSSKYLLFSFPQMLAHHSVTGCPMQVGDLIGSGTISGTKLYEHGSLLEQSANGTSSVELNGGEKRTFLNDGDTVTMRGWAKGADGDLVGFGECIGQIEPAKMP